MSEALKDEVSRIVADLFDLSPGLVTEDASPETIEGWDSLQHLNLVVGLEQAFDIAFTPEEIQELVSVGAIARTVGAKLAAVSSAAERG
jgi:acyl carrier protein